jgi:hypothetical protein
MLTVRPSEAAELREHLARLEAEFTEKRAAAESLQIELQRFQARYLRELGREYADLAAVHAAIEEAEVRLGVRPPVDPTDETDDAEGSAAGEGCSNQAEPSVDLKKMFRDIAKAIHPDRAHNSAARDRRHSLMAEANRAYADRDEDRLRLILRVWERSPEAVPGDDPEAARIRLERRVAELREQVLALDLELVDLARSAIAKLKQRADEAAAEGWDLFVEMRRQVRREIMTAKFRLTGLQ